MLRVYNELGKDFLEEGGIFGGIRTKGYVEWCVTAMVHVCGDESLRMWLHPGTTKGKEKLAPVLVTADVSGVDEIPVRGKEGRNQGQDLGFYGGTIGFGEDVNWRVDCVKCVLAPSSIPWS